MLLTVILYFQAPSTCLALLMGQLQDLLVLSGCPIVSLLFIMWPDFLYLVGSLFLGCLKPFYPYDEGFFRLAPSSQSHQYQQSLAWPPNQVKCNNCPFKQQEP